MAQDRKAYLRELMNGVPFVSAEERAARIADIETWGPERIEETIARFEKAYEHWQRASDILEKAKPLLDVLDRERREALQKDPALPLRQELCRLLDYYLPGPEARQEAVQSFYAMNPEEVKEALVQLREAVAQLPEDDRDFIERVIEARIGIGAWLTPAKKEPK